MKLKVKENRLPEPLRKIPTEVFSSMATAIEEMIEDGMYLDTIIVWHKITQDCTQMDISREFGLSRHYIYLTMKYFYSKTKEIYEEKHGKYQGTH